MSEPYNPLDKKNLGNSIASELLKQDPELLSTGMKVTGAGIYVLYYVGPFEAYKRITEQNSDGQFSCPIYIGKAIPQGGRKGGLTFDAATGRALSQRLSDHARSIDAAKNTLRLKDFYVRYLVVDDIWIPLGENVLISKYKPLWNQAIDGFGNKTPGRRRANQFRSPWDVLHPGREWAEMLGQGPVTADFLVQRVDDFLSGKPMQALPKELQEQLNEDKDDGAVEA